MSNFPSTFFLRRCGLILLFLAGLTARSYAINPVPYTEAVTFSFQFTGSGAPTMWVYDESYAQNPTLPAPNSTYPNPAIPGGTESVPATAWLIPGKTYNITFQSASLTQYWMSFIAPTGYEVLVDGVAMDLFTSTAKGTAGAVSDPHTIQIRPLAQMVRLDAAAFTGFNIGKSISWSVGLGGLHSGHAAGQILYRQQDLTLSPPSNDSPASRDRLIYVAPIYPATMTSQITVIRDGASTQVLRQIIAPQAIVDLVDDAGGNGYKMNFYGPTQGTPAGTNLPYTLTGSPWRTIHVQSVAAGNQMTVTETEGTVSRVSFLALSSGTVVSGTYVLTLQEGDGTTWLRTTTHTSTNNGDGTRDDVVAVRTGAAAGAVVAKTKYHYANFNWGEQTTQVTTDPDTTALTTTFTYGTSGAALGNYTRILSVTDPTGKWSASAYYDDWNNRGQLKTQFLPFGNLPAAVSTDLTLGRVTSFTYAADWTGRYTRPFAQSVTINNHQAGNKTWTYDTMNNPAWSLARDEAAVASFSSASASLSSRVESVSSQSGSPDEMGETYLIKNADQTQTSLSRIAGTYSAGSFTVNASGTYWRELTLSGSTSGTGAEQQSSYNVQSFDPLYLVPNKSTLQVVVRDPAGNALTTSSFVYQTGNNWAALASATNTYDVAGRLTQSVASNGATTVNTITNGQLVKSVDASGVETDYNYDLIGRVLSTVRKGVLASGSYAAQPDITTTNTYDGAGHITKQVVGTSGSSETITSINIYDLSGRLTSQTPAGLGTTTFTYNSLARTETVTAPSTNTVASGNVNGTTIKTYQLDGQLGSVTGTSVIAQTYVHGFDATASQHYTQVYSGNNGTASPRVQQTWTDWLGRTVKTQKPGFSQSAQANYVEQSTYDATTGLLTKKISTGSAPILYVYNTMAQLIRSGLDVNSDGSLVFASTDRITDQDISFYKDTSNNWWVQSVATAYPFSGATAATGVTTSTSRSRITGFTGNVQAETQTIDAEGNSTSTVTTVVRASQLVTTAVTSPGLVNAQTGVSYNGLGVARTGYDNLTSTQQYDSLLRPWKSTDPRGNAITTAYITGTSLIQTVTDAAANTVTTTTYDGNGRVLTTQNALGKFTRTGYDSLGRVTNVWGSATNPVSYGFDAIYGDKISMSTYRSAPAVDSLTWPVVGTADTTQWTNDAATALMWKKTDAAGKFVQFDYNPCRQTISRQWARALVNSVGNVTTSYTYDTATGELLTTSYNDGAEAFPTATVSNTYTRSGQLKTVTDASGTRTFAYDPSLAWRLNSETLPSFYGTPASSTRMITRLYESASSASAGTFGSFTKGTVKGRADGFDLGNGTNATADLQQTYSFSNLGQFAGIASQVGASAAQTFTYSYMANSELVNGYTVGANFSVGRTYEPTRDLVTSIQTSWGATNVSRFDFVYDALGRRQTSKLSGTAYADYYSGMTYSSVYNLYGYNDRSELQTSAMYPGDTASLAPSAPELPGRRFEYRYDSIGNRKTSGETGNSVANGGADDSYTANALNQYTAKDNLTVRVIGTAAAAAHVAVASAPSTGKSDRAWGADVVATNTTAAVQGSVTAYTALIGAGTGGKDIINSATKPYFIPQAAQTFSYDADGNLTTDTVWNYSYNAENQLVRLSTALPSGSGYIRLRLDFIYDYLGRRVAKTVTNLDTSTAILSRRFIYDNWNLIAELDGTGANLQRSYTWGVDLTGDLARAGGVGALVQIYDYGSSKTFWPTYDSNGNVATLVNASTGGLAAVYEYDPFGNYLQAKVTDLTVQDNPWRFSSKYSDQESSLVYYGHRYYSSNLGRFINKDPIEEKGGLNLYAFCLNNAVNGYDYLGHSLYLYSDENGTQYRETFDPPGVGNAPGSLWSTYDSDTAFIDSSTATAQAATPPTQAQPAFNTKPAAPASDDNTPSFGDNTSPATSPVSLVAQSNFINTSQDTTPADPSTPLGNEGAAGQAGTPAVNSTIPGSFGNPINGQWVYSSATYPDEMGNHFPIAAVNISTSEVADLFQPARGITPLLFGSEGTPLEPVLLVAGAAGLARTALNIGRESVESALAPLSQTQMSSLGTGWTPSASAFQLALNAEAGAAFSDMVASRAAAKGATVLREVSVSPFLDDGSLAAYRFRADTIAIGDTAAPVQSAELLEAKGSATAPFTVNQLKGFPMFENNGGIIRGANGGSLLPNGTVMPPSSITTVRPN